MSNVELLAGIILFLMAAVVIWVIGSWLLEFLRELFEAFFDLIAFPFRRHWHYKKCTEQVCIPGCMYYGNPRPKEKPDDWEQRQIVQRWAIQEAEVTAMETRGQVTSQQANDMRTSCREQQQQEIKKAKSAHWA